jgi:hypothetical protein
MEDAKAIGRKAIIVLPTGRTADSAGDEHTNVTGSIAQNLAGT